MKNDINSNNDDANTVYSAVGSLLATIPGGVVQFELSEECKIHFITDKMLEIIGCNRFQFRAKYNDNIINLIYYEDRQGMQNTMLDAFRLHSSKDTQCRIVDYNENVKWVSVNIQVLEANDKGISGYAVVTDIDEYKKTERMLEQEKYLLQLEKDKYKKLLNTNADLFFEYNILTDLINFNSDEGTFNIAKQQMDNFIDRLAKSTKIHHDDKAKILELRFISKKTEIQFRYISVDESIIWCKIKAVPIDDGFGKIKSIIGWVNNIDKQKKEEEYQLEKSRRDPLTRLYNGSSTECEIVDFLNTDGSDGFHALFIVDIDNFKHINEKFGNIFGDAVLVNIAENLQKIFYNSDIMGRVGGDEFLVFIKNVHAINILVEKMDEVREVVGNTYAGENLESQISCSIGIAIYPENGETYEELFKNADSALFYAKYLGKNRYEFFDGTDIEKLPLNNTEYYNDYSVDTAKKQGFSSFNREITTFAFDIMARTKDVNSAINLILDKVGKQFDATYVNIIEIGSKKARMTYSWNRNIAKKKKENISFKADEKFVEKYARNYDEQGIFSIEDVSKLEKDFYLNWLYEKNNVKAALQCAIVENGKVEGCVSILDSQKTRKWTKNEIDSLVTITKVIASYLLKMRASQKMEERLNEVKNYDALTGLPTLFKFKNDARSLLSDNPKKKYVIINMDFYRFKAINNIFGYEIGDSILRDFGDYLTGPDMTNIINCRVSSDNFLAIMEFKSEKEVIDRMDFFSNEFSIMQKEKNNTLNIRLCIGASLIESNLGDIMVPIDNSNIARKYAKENSLEHCFFFNAQMQEKIQTEFEITNTMEKALAHNEFKVYLQPKVCLADGSLAGAEALVRWVRPDKTIMPPDKFIPLFEKNGFVVNLDFFVYEEVCKMLREWIDKGMKVVPISVNVSRVHLYDEKFVDDFIKVIESYNIPNEYIELELTESIFLDNTEVAIATMRRCRSLGFKVSIDDFGAGYSSLNLLKEMTSDVLKLDKGFFGKGELQKEEQIIVSSIVNMAKQLNMKVLSEGVETTSQSEFLKNIDCDLAQGYLYAKPMPKENFEVIMSNNLQFGV